VVMGIHGRGRPDLALFGSTAQHVVREAGCAVLTVPCADGVTRGGGVRELTGAGAKY